MKLFVVVSCLVALVHCAPKSQSFNPLRNLPAVRHEEIRDEYGQYALRYVTAENTVVSEVGRLVPTANGGYVLEIQGQYEFIGDDGLLYVTEYRGGTDGFHVTGTHLPKPVVDLPIAAIPVPAIKMSQ